MSKYTKDDVIRMVQEEDVEFIRLQFTDIFGHLKNVAVTTSHLERALNNRVLFDGSAIEGFVSAEESDMYLYPDPGTFTIFPWRPQNGKVARLLCEIYHPDGQPFEGDPRHVLSEVLADAAKDGYRFLTGPECEFFLYHLDENGLPTTLTHERAGYFDVGPTDLGENARRDMVLTMEEMGYEIEASHHEFAPAQHEIDLHYANPLKTADMIMTFRLTARTIAKRHGLYATFMPKPHSGIHGSGMHINISMAADGMNVFADENDELGLSRQAYYFIGGVMKHIKGMTAILNPLVNSYKRLVSGYEAPREIAWSSTDRDMLIRVPAIRGFNTRIELRSPDPAANPYLTLALILAAGMEGIRGQIMPPAPTNHTTRSAGADHLPSSLAEALDEMEKDPLVRRVLGDHITDKFLEAKRKEWEEYVLQVSEWELDRYLPLF